MNRSLLKDKFTAFLIHFFVSLVLISAFIMVVIYFWYAPNLWHLGAKQGLTILIGVDLVLGPLLMLVVYKKGKRNLPFDLSVIFGIQIVCFIYGAQLIIEERPALQIISEEGITILTPSELKSFDTKETVGLFTQNQLSFVTLPSELAKIVTSKTVKELTTGVPYAYQSDKMITLDKVTKQEFAERVILINKFLSEQNEPIFKNLSEKNKQNCSIVPIKSKHKSNAYACINRQQGIVFTSEF